MRALVKLGKMFFISLQNSVPIKGSWFVNCESFLDFHKSFFENILKIANSFIANSKNPQINFVKSLNFNESTYKI